MREIRGMNLCYGNRTKKTDFGHNVARVDLLTHVLEQSRDELDL